MSVAKGTWELTTFLRLGSCFLTPTSLSTLALTRVASFCLQPLARLLIYSINLLMSSTATSSHTTEFYTRDIVECLHALWGDPDFDGDLILEPEQLYADEDMTICIYHEMNTGKWWWDTQVEISTLFFCSQCLQ